MLELLALNTRVHLRFYARNRLLLAFALLMIGILSVWMIPMLLWDTSANRFSQLQVVIGQLGGFAVVFTASLGLFAVSSHVRARNVKLVLTKPCAPSIWLASIFLSAAFVGLILYSLIALVSLGLSLAWKIPLQAGLLFTAIDGFFQSIVWLGFVTTLTMAFHPVVAVMVALFLNDGVFYQLKFLIAGAQLADGKRLWLPIAGFLCDALYGLLPMSHPFDDRTEHVYSSWRVASADWLVLAGVAGYTLLTVTFFYLVSLFLLRRKDLI